MRSFVLSAIIIFSSTASAMQRTISLKCTSLPKRTVQTSCIQKRQLYIQNRNYTSNAFWYSMGLGTGIALDDSDDVRQELKQVQRKHRKESLEIYSDVLSLLKANNVEKYNELKSLLNQKAQIAANQVKKDLESDRVLTYVKLNSWFLMRQSTKGKLQTQLAELDKKLKDLECLKDEFNKLDQPD